MVFIHRTADGLTLRISKSSKQKVCVFITAGPITKLFAGGGGRRRVEDMCYERRQDEACEDESAHHALANAGGREIVGKKEGETSRRGVREGACIGGATMIQPWTLRLTRNVAALTTVSPTLLFRPL